MKTHFISESGPLMKTLEGLIGFVDAAGGPDERADRQQKSAVVAKSFKQAFEETGQYMGDQLAESIHSRARVDRGNNEKYMSWTRHLYQGGNPKNMGNPDRALFSFTGVGAVNGFSVVLATEDDFAPSWSPVSHSTRGAVNKRNYPAWEERAEFILAAYLDKPDDMIITGNRKGNKTLPKYIISRGKVNRERVMTADTEGADERYIYAEQFRADYSIQKKQRDAILADRSRVTVNRIMSMLDRDFERTMNQELARFKVGPVGRAQTKKGPGSIASDGVDPANIKQWSARWATAFLKNVKASRQGGGT